MPTNQTPEEQFDAAVEGVRDWLRTKQALYLSVKSARSLVTLVAASLRDMAVSGAKDAERYRWLRDSRRIPRDDDPERHAVIVAPGGEDVLWGTSLDATCDAAIAATKRG